jgi:hypothetical protein
MEGNGKNSEIYLFFIDSISFAIINYMTSIRFYGDPI